MKTRPFCAPSQQCEIHKQRLVVVLVRRAVFTTAPLAAVKAHPQFERVEFTRLRLSAPNPTVRGVHDSQPVISQLTFIS